MRIHQLIKEDGISSLWVQCNDDVISSVLIAVFVCDNTGIAGICTTSNNDYLVSIKPTLFDFGSFVSGNSQHIIFCYPASFDICCPDKLEFSVLRESWRLACPITNIQHKGFKRSDLASLSIGYWISEQLYKLRIANSYPMNLRWDSFTLF